MFLRDTALCFEDIDHTSRIDRGFDFADTGPRIGRCCNVPYRKTQGMGREKSSRSLVAGYDSLQVIARVAIGCYAVLYLLLSTPLQRAASPPFPFTRCGINYTLQRRSWGLHMNRHSMRIVPY